MLFTQSFSYAEEASRKLREIKILMKRKCDILHSVISKFVHQLKFVFINLLHFIPCYID